ncbi:DUF3240 family protein [Dokdonella sp.]|uniref:DUF3240 family protein n=1 Tax=Dokdonella sp. TaxID=2291710 RepID=UPI003528285A
MNNWIRMNLLFPPQLETLITETLSADPRMPGYTLLRAEGHANSFARASDAERVRGRVEKRLLWLVIPAEAKDDVLHLLREHTGSHELRWWTEAVLDRGSL